MDSTFDTFQTPSDCSTELPTVLHLAKFGNARYKEIEYMKKILASTGSSTKLVFQKLPRHMRRRAMSHNSKRLPRRLREIHLNQMKKSGLPPKQRRPSRKYRRKPSNLLQEYDRRQSKVKWLRTHVWYAKRFHMVQKWGYKIPYSPCDKAFTSCYRATKNYCLIQDVSYFQCIELCGNLELLLEGLKKITCPEDGLFIGSKPFIHGFREGITTLYQFNSNFKKPIGSVQFLWNYEEECFKKLWLWVHAAFYDELQNTLLKCFELELHESELYFSSLKGIELRELRTELSRLQLSGNLSNRVLQSCFKLQSTRCFSEWFRNFSKYNNEAVSNQHNYWEELKFARTVNILTPHIVLPLIIHDPRFNYLEIQKNNEIFPKYDICLKKPSSAVSPLWNTISREKINSSKVSNSEVAKLRSNFLIPSEALTELGCSVPIILIQRPGSRNDCLGYSSGWDIILPSSWTQPIWVSLIMSGARSGGLREFQCNRFEMGKPDLLDPDTSAGELEEKTICDDYVKTYFKKPPNKRTNYNKFKTASPFTLNWRLLIENWSHHQVNEFLVLRDKNLLANLDESITNGKKCLSVRDNCLVPVQVECAKDIPRKFAIICIPEMQDLKNPPVESVSIDVNQNKRKMMRKQHKTLLERLRQRRRRKKQLGKVITLADKADLVKYSQEMKKLWIPDALNIRNSCSREIIGFIKDGGFSYVLGSGKGIGYIASAAVNNLIDCKTGRQILIRNTNSRNYFIAKLFVIKDA